MKTGFADEMRLGLWTAVVLAVILGFDMPGPWHSDTSPNLLTAQAQTLTFARTASSLIGYTWESAGGLATPPEGQRLQSPVIRGSNPQAGLVAQTGSDISIESRVDKSTIRIGDVIRYSVVIRRSPEIEVETPGLAANLGSFEIRDYEVQDPQKREGRIVERVDYLISTFEVGEFEIPPLTIRYRAVGDTVWKSLQTETLRIVVESMKPSEAGDIRDIKEPLEIPRDWLRTLAPWVAGALVLGLVAVAYQIYRRKKAGKALLPARVEPPRPPHEVALEELAALRASTLLQEGAYKEFYSRLSEIIRRYMEGRFYIDAMEMTTFEVLGQLRQIPDLQTADIELVTQFLGFCDLVKFAKYTPSAEEIERSLAEAEEIVQRTRIAAIAHEETEVEQPVESQDSRETEPAAAAESES